MPRRWKTLRPHWKGDGESSSDLFALSTREGKISTVMKDRTRTTLQDIADEANLSRTTVSLALRNHPRISASTTARVKEVAQRLGYRPNPRLAELMHYLRKPEIAQEGETLAYVVPTKKDVNLESQLKRHLHNFEGARDRAAELGFGFRVFELRRPEVRDAAIDRQLYASGIRGVILSPFPNPRERMLMKWERYSVARIAYTIEEPKANRVSGHHFHNAYLAIEKLRSYGYERIGLVLDPTLNERTSHLWRAAYADYCLNIASGNPTGGLLESIDDGDLVDWYQSFRPDAIIGNETDRVIEILGGRGYACPRDFGYARIGRFEEQDEYAGVVNQRRKIGAIAVETVAAMIARNETGIPRTPKTVMIDGYWKDGPTAPKRGEIDVSENAESAV